MNDFWMLYGNMPIVPPILNAVSLGAIGSPICIPYLTTTLYFPPDWRRTLLAVSMDSGLGSRIVVRQRS